MRRFLVCNIMCGTVVYEIGTAMFSLIGIPHDT